MNLFYQVHLELHNNTCKHPLHVTHKKKRGEYLLEFFMAFLTVTPGDFVGNQPLKKMITHILVENNKKIERLQQKPSRSWKE